MRIFILTLLLCLHAGSTMACRCGQKNIADYFDAAEAVIKGRIEHVQQISEAGHQYRVAHISLLAVYKGNRFITRLRTEISSASCGINFQVGETYWIFGRQIDSRTLAVNSCDGSRASHHIFQDVQMKQTDQRLKALGRKTSALAGDNCQLDDVTTVLSRIRLSSLQRNIAASELVYSPNRAYAFAVESPSAFQRPPHIARIYISRDGEHNLLLQLHQLVEAVDPQWVNEKLLFINSRWSSRLSSQMLFDIETASFRYHTLECGD